MSFSSLEEKISEYLAAGRYKEAESLLEEACRMMPNALEPRRQLGGLYLQKGEWGAAMEWLRQALKLAPDDASLQYQLAWCLCATECPEGAIPLLERLPATPPHQHLLGKAYLFSGQLTLALDSLQNSNLPAADLEMGWCYWLLDDPTQASHAWERWMRAGAADWGTKDALATFWFLLGAGAGPRGVPERVLEPTRHMQKWFKLLLRYQRMHDVTTVIKKGAELSPAVWTALRPALKIACLHADEPGLAEKL